MMKNFREYRTLGKTGLEISRLGIASAYGLPTEAIEKGFYEYGINYFLWSSPKNKKMGAALKNICKKDREKVVTVFQSYDHSGILTPRSVEKGLKILGTDYTDVLLLGWYNYLPRRVVEKAMLLKKEGKIRFIALSGHNRKLFGKLAADPDSPIDILMFRYNAVHTGAEKDIFPNIPEKDAPGVTIYTSTAWRKLLDPKKMPAGEKPLTASECYRFVLSHPKTDLCFTAPSTQEQLEENIKTLDDGPLSEKEMDRVRRIGKYIYKK